MSLPLYALVQGRSLKSVKESLLRSDLCIFFPCSLFFFEPVKSQTNSVPSKVRSLRATIISFQSCEQYEMLKFKKPGRKHLLFVTLMGPVGRTDDGVITLGLLLSWDHSSLYFLTS